MVVAWKMRSVAVASLKTQKKMITIKTGEVMDN
jgi:hypothetical protein